MGPQCQALDLLLGEDVPDLVEIIVVRRDAAFKRRKADSKLTVKATGTLQRLVEYVGGVGRHHMKNAVFRRLLGRHVEEFAEASGDDSLRLLESGHLGQNGLERAHAAAAAHHRVDDLSDLAEPTRFLCRSGVYRVPLVDDVGRGRRIGIVESATHERVGAERLRLCPSAHVHTAVAETVGFVEEGDDAAVTDRQFAELLVQALHFHDADAHEHGLKSTRINEDERLSGLARTGFRDERLSGAGGTPEQDSAGNMAALALDLCWVLEQLHRLSNLRYDSILTFDVVEALPYFIGFEGIDAAPRHEPEDGHKLNDRDEENEGNLDDEWHAGPSREQELPDPSWGLSHGRKGRNLPEVGEEHYRDGRDTETLGDPQQSEAHPRIAPRPEAVPAAPHLVDPEQVVTARFLTGQIVRLPDKFNGDDEEDQPFRFTFASDRLAPRGQRIISVAFGQRKAEVHKQTKDDLRPIEEHQLFSDLGPSPVGPRDVGHRCGDLLDGLAHGVLSLLGVCAMTQRYLDLGDTTSTVLILFLGYVWSPLRRSWLDG